MIRMAKQTRANKLAQLRRAEAEMAVGLAIVEMDDAPGLGDIAATMAGLAIAAEGLATEAATGWDLGPAGDYAQPRLSNGYVEVQGNGDFEVAYETDQSWRDRGADSFLITRIPVAIVRELLNRFDEKAGA
jgi:hypothetical protein